VIDTKWKIQTASANGWADLKVSVDGGPYEDNHYDTLEEAIAELNNLITFFESDGTDFRVVKANIQECRELY